MVETALILNTTLTLTLSPSLTLILTLNLTLHSSKNLSFWRGGGWGHIPPPTNIFSNLPLLPQSASVPYSQSCSYSPALILNLILTLTLKFNVEGVQVDILPICHHQFMIKTMKIKHRFRWEWNSCIQLSANKTRLSFSYIVSKNSP